MAKKIISIYVEDQLIRKIDKSAEKNLRSRNREVELAVREKFEKNEKNEK